ncbi:relaxase/mobilization nuclease domain-containing protein [Pacificimonas flava]|uniref:MobA/VirD2-like nuclease domain-containing protein n=1 Tax=Pacificimonas flava TaxID=1234595 RepID=M2S8W2_9SPHN|nr:relaxase/mobilization nuclease domain-containing protein [Pacificimonas flava]EMD81805.1 hypothetical protein C725_2787 [Pacificimonas flava]MBB5281663.1 hypothetical protein [Pacificimonas flava]
MIPKLTKGADFAGLIHYLVTDRDHEVLDLHGVSSIEMAPAEMANIAALNSRAKVKLLHLSVSAAIEDGELNREQWLSIADAMGATAGLTNHPRVVIRHRDKAYDHSHIFWCTISPETGRTPSKSWFLKKGSAADCGPHILTADQVLAVPGNERALRSYDFRLLARLQNCARRMERAMGLRQLRSPQGLREDRIKGLRNQIPAKSKLVERTGDRDLMALADDIRAALVRTSWGERVESLMLLDLGLEAVFRETSKGAQRRGFVIVDRRNQKNRIKASAFDSGQTKFGASALERSLKPGAPSYQEWRNKYCPVDRRKSSDAPSDLKESYSWMVEQHRLREDAKRIERKRLRKIHLAEVKRLRRELMRQRQKTAQTLKSSERRAFYRHFSVAIRAPALAELLATQRAERRAFAVERCVTWIEYKARYEPRQPIQAQSPSSRSRPKLVSTGSTSYQRGMSSPAPDLETDRDGKFETSDRDLGNVSGEGLSAYELLIAQQNLRQSRGR